MPPSLHREKEILGRLQHGDASIHELAETLHVSAMTVHRDLNRLAAAGLVLKTHGGVSLAPPSRLSNLDGCAMCGKPVTERTVFIINLPNGERKRACCAHCGLMLQFQFEATGHSLTSDFLHTHMVSATQAFYVVHSDVIVCCAPSILTFGSHLEAERFQSGFGGDLMDMQSVIRWLTIQMP